MQQRSPATWTLTDGNAGNVRQAEALARALGLDARAWALEARAPWAWWAPRRFPGDAAAFGLEFQHAMAEPPELAIGCGRRAALATRLLGARGAHTVQILAPRIASRHWDLVVAPEHDGLDGANVIRTLGSLNPVDDAWLAAARREFAALGEFPGPRTALLLGGHSRHSNFDSALLGQAAARIGAAVAREGGSVLATASRRTPATARTHLRERFLGIPGVVWTGIEPGPNPYPGLLAWADRIVCTADSVNMLSEACATEVPVFVAGTEGLHGRPRRFLDSLLGSGRVRLLDDALADWPVTPLRETARVAAEVRARLEL